ncbi:MAG: hypothetical protein JO256_08455 [Alphaproteobacteria bacterium]|nr:hypothetical protein [Alphaproteobacteria bacterium]
MRRAAIVLTGHFLLCGLVWATAQDLRYPGDPPPPPPPLDGPSDTYIALRGSLSFDGKGSNVSIPTTPAATALRPSHDVGGGGAIALGAELPYGIRLETEALYRNRPVNSVNLGGTVLPAGGNVQQAAGMFNLVWAPQLDDLPVRPMIGGGIGGAYTYGQVTDPTGANVYLQPRGWHLAYQGMAGLEVPLMPGASLTAAYRWLHTDNVGARCGVAGTATLSCKKFGLDDQSVDVGVKVDLP